MNYYVMHTQTNGEQFNLMGHINPNWISISRSGASTYTASDIDMIVSAVYRLDEENDVVDITLSPSNDDDDEAHNYVGEDVGLEEWLQSFFVEQEAQRLADEWYERSEDSDSGFNIWAIANVDAAIVEALMDGKDTYADLERARSRVIDAAVAKL